MLTDTHCHIDLLCATGPNGLLLEKDLPAAKQIIDKATAAGVTRLVNVGCDLITSKNSVLLAQSFDTVSATVGIHPTDCNDDSWKSELEEITKLTNDLSGNKIVGIGEIGLDYFHKPFNKENQKKAFVAQIELALSLNLPMSIHVREAGDDLLKVLAPYASSSRAVIHCFQQSLDFAKQAIEWGFVLGIDGPITYPKANSLREVVSQLELENLVLETDSPFLPPQSIRGKQNSPAMIPEIAEKIAELYEVGVDDVARVTTSNAKKLFSLS